MNRSDDWAERVGKLLGWVMAFLLRAWLLMFIIAVVAKRFGVLEGTGFDESLAWSAAYGLVRGLWKSDEEPGK